MSMSHEAIALRGSLIRLQAIIGIILEAGAQINEEHTQELSKYIDELGFVNESFLYERVISLINTGDYKSYTRSPNELIDAMAARVGDQNISGLLSASDTLKKITSPREYKRVDFADVMEKQKTSVTDKIIEETKSHLNKAFLQGCLHWPDNRLLAAHMAVNVTNGMLNIRGMRRYIYRVNLVEDTGEVVLKVTDLAGNVVIDQIVADLLNKKWSHLESPVHQMALQLINSTSLPTFDDCAAIDDELRGMYTTFISSKVEGVTGVEIVTSKYAANGRPFYLIRVDASGLDHPIVFPVYMA